MYAMKFVRIEICLQISDDLLGNRQTRDGHFVGKI